ncbi:MAG: 30S ribosomal protein S4 [Candidatus Riflebacteria bacterium]|nr:30S ribosomal protein S4 [Candidatus Riflebacteria bacterium]
MARYTGPSCRICRKEGDALFLKGARCYTDKCAFKKRPRIPGQHGPTKMNKKHTGYEVQLRAKQKVRKIYGLLEAAFRLYYDRAVSQSGNSGHNLLTLLEKRLDNVVYRLGFGMSRSQARMWVTHGHFMVNGKPVDIPSYSLRPGDTVTVRESSSLKQTLKDILDKTSSRDKSSWLEIDREAMKGRFLNVPQREELDPKLQESLIIEYYSR